MLKSTLILKGAAMAVAALVITGASQTAFAVPKEQGNFDCSCKDGLGSCTFQSNGSEISCYYGYGDTCSGTCNLTTSPIGAGGISRGAGKGGPIGSAGSAATH